jgi:hypothetical protein
LPAGLLGHERDAFPGGAQVAKKRPIRPEAPPGGVAERGRGWQERDVGAARGPGRWTEGGGEAAGSTTRSGGSLRIGRPSTEAHRCPSTRQPGVTPATSAAALQLRCCRAHPRPHLRVGLRSVSKETSVYAQQ